MDDVYHISTIYIEANILANEAHMSYIHSAGT